MRLLLSLLLLLPGLAVAQTVTVTLPSIRFERPPPLVVLQPGIQVIEDYDDDLYIVNGRYYTRRGGHWYRAHDHRGHWKRVHKRHVPRSLVGFRPGEHRRWRRHHAPPGHVRKARAKEMRRAEKAHHKRMERREKAHRKEMKRRDKAHHRDMKRRGKSDRRHRGRD